jgi:hypothetical protein
VDAVIARGIVALAVALPWLVLAPLHGVAAAIAQLLIVAAALHGAGIAVGWLAGERAVPPLLAVQWGMAALIGASGIAIAAHAGTRAVQLALVLVGAAVHSAVLAIRSDEFVERTRAALAAPRSWLVPAGLLAGLAAVHLLGAAGGDFAQPFDDDGHLVAQLRRVLDTGALGDPIGYRRRGGLGAQVALAALAASPGGAFATVVEPLAAALALGLAVARIGPRDRARALWATALVAAGYALPFAPYDPLPCWTAVGLLTALYQMTGDDAAPPALPLGITAGALAALRVELAPIAAVAVVAMGWRWRHDRRRLALLTGGALGVVLPFWIARALAWRTIAPGGAPAVQAALRALGAEPAMSLAGLAARAGLAAAIAFPVAWLLRLAVPDSRGLRVAAATTAVALGAVVARLVGSWPFALRLVLPIAIGFAIALIVELARSRRTGAAALIGSLALCAVIHEGASTTGRRRWSVRLSAAAADIAYVRRPPAAPAAVYAPLLAGVPAGATVAAWVAEPERLDYARHRIVDLRAPATARLRDHRWVPHASTAAPLLDGLAADYLLIEADDARVLRTQTDLFYRWLCRTWQPICDDDLEAIARDHRAVAERAGVRLIDLHRPPDAPAAARW